MACPVGAPAAGSPTSVGVTSTAPPGGDLAGFFGRSGAEIDQLGRSGAEIDQLGRSGAEIDQLGRSGAEIDQLGGDLGCRGRRLVSECG
ncbi:hypothetical protein QQG74_22890 [Micromonospora sp. FIMYZ51]|uniref:hypothetical protein n=1 Tax=Micromonospora sp. FIMYZ51 TaxID=3051832 RepID=UPI00311ECB4C